MRMRDKREIEREMYRAREDLEASLGELKHVVQEKVDIKARAQHALDERVEKAKNQARAYYYKGRYNAGLAYDKSREAVGAAYGKSRDAVMARPYTSAAILGGVLLATVGAIYLIHRHNQKLI
jgi:ElaB/YqjD/DUF883 family membrane-anchored ribosome-binding protein